MQMPVWFVYRSFEVEPTGKHLRRFEDDTVLTWFKRTWASLAVPNRTLADEQLEEVLGYGGWPLYRPFQQAAEDGLPAPDNLEEVRNRLTTRVSTALPGSPH